MFDLFDMKWYLLFSVGASAYMYEYKMFLVWYNSIYHKYRLY